MYYSFPNAAKGIRWLFIAEILAIVAVPTMFIGIGVLLALASGVLNVVAIYTASHDDAGYKAAFMGVIVALVANFINSFGQNSIISAVISLANLFVTYQVITTTANLLTGRDSQTAEMGRNVIRIYVICALISIVANILAIIPILGTAVAAILSVVIVIAQLVGGIMYLMFLNRASKSLA